MSEEKLIETLDQRLNNKKEEIAANLLKVAVERIVKESNWFTSIGLALLGFFTALLIQLKLADIQPLNFNAIVALVTLVISLGAGFWIKLCSMKDDILKNLKPVLVKVIDATIKNTLNDFEELEIEETFDEDSQEKSDKKKLKDADQILESVSLPSGLIIVQGSSLVISIIAVFIYLMYFIL